MQSSSSTRRKTAFVPWLAALIIGATAHAGWLIHELREQPADEAARVEIDVDVTRPRMLPHEVEHDLDLWIHRTDRYTYTIDRRALERVALADYDFGELERIGVVARAIGLAEPIELRNIRAGTPLFLLGLRTGDRLHGISTRGGAVIERVEVAIERRGRPIELVYRLI